MDLGLKGKVALVTGASKGIGRAVATALAAAGAQPVILSRSQENLNAASEEILKETGVRPMAVQGDVSDPGIAIRVVGEVWSQYDRLDILVNNAEGPPMGTFLDHDEAAWLQAYNQCLYSTVQFSKAAVPFMREKNWGRIVNVTSILAKEPAPAMVLSSTMRAGVSAFAKAISRELAPYGITVNTCCPAAVLTERMVNLTRTAATRENRAYEDILADAQKSIPAGRFSTPEEMADLVVFLCSDRAAYLTGQTISLDGGLTKGTF